MNYDFKNMKIHGADRLSVLTHENPEQLTNAMNLYNATEGKDFVSLLELPYLKL